MAMRSSDAFFLQNWFRRRESYPSLRPVYDIDSSSPPKAYSSRNISYLAERYGYSDYVFREGRSTFCHPYFEPERIPLRTETPVVSLPDKYLKPVKYRRYRLNTENSSPKRKLHNRVKNFNEDVYPLKANIFVKSEDGGLIKSEENAGYGSSEEADFSVMSYCLDRQTQHTITSLQNDFRLTKKYKSFMMYEMPLISDFKPTPVATTNKFHDRFKCLFKQLLDVKDSNVSLDLDIENSSQKPEAVENVEAEEKKELSNAV